MSKVYPVPMCADNLAGAVLEEVQRQAEQLARDAVDRVRRDLEQRTGR
jgi:hypothetical protein